MSWVHSNLINLIFIVSSPAKGRFRSEIRLRSSYSTPFCFKPSCQCTPLFNLHPLIFGVKALGWVRCARPVPSHSIIYYGNIIFDLRLLFQAHKGRKTRACCSLQLEYNSSGMKWEFLSVCDKRKHDTENKLIRRYFVWNILCFCPER